MNPLPTASELATRSTGLASSCAVTVLACLSFFPLLLYPFAFHDDLVVPYAADCGSALRVYGKMGRPGQGLAYCLNANLFPGYEGTRSARLLSLAVLLVSAFAFARFAIREGLPFREASLLSLLIFISVPSVMLVFYLASVGELYGNLLAILAALAAQGFCSVRFDERRSATWWKGRGFLLVSLVLGVAAYGFYQLSGVFYFAVTSLSLLAAIHRSEPRTSLKRTLSYFAIGLAALLAYALAFWLLRVEVHWSGEPFGFWNWVEGVRPERLVRTFFDAPWGILPRLFAPWFIIGGPIDVPYPLFLSIFVIANLGIVFTILFRMDLGPIQRVACAVGWPLYIVAMVALLYSPVVLGGSYYGTYRVLVPMQAFILIVSFVGMGLVFEQIAQRSHNRIMWLAVSVIAAVSTAAYTHRTLAEPARAEFDYVRDSVAAAITQRKDRLPVHIVVPALRDQGLHDEYGHLSSYYTTWGNRDAQVLVNIARRSLGHAPLPPAMFSFSVGTRSVPQDHEHWLIDLYPLLDTGMYFKHVP